LEGCCSTIELHPRRLSAPQSDTARLKAPFLAIRAREVNSRKGSALCVCNAFVTLGTQLPAGRITKARASGPETGITISFRKGAATYTLFHFNDGYTADAVCPRGTGLVNPSTFPSLGPQPIPFQVGILINAGTRGDSLRYEDKPNAPTWVVLVVGLGAGGGVTYREDHEFAQRVSPIVWGFGTLSRSMSPPRAATLSFSTR
jgi:hypothetical protein